MKTQLTSLVLASLTVCAFTGSEPEEGYVAHEWGTFTSVQGADGNPLEWHPLVTTELPSFVHDRSRSEPGSGTGRQFEFPPKSALVALQRMETPVIYFYSSIEQNVDVDVSFPLGLMTEWYPQAGAASGTISGQERLSGGDGHLRWPRVQVFPRQAHAELGKALPTDKSGSHYFAARGTDADFLRVNLPGQDGTTVETEKFLFYRGVGSFAAPLRISMAGDEGQLHLANKGTDPLTHLFVIELRQGRGWFSQFDHLAPADETAVKLRTASIPMPVADLAERVGAALRAALEQEGLYTREAEAMVATWKDSWLGEDGLRVLYLLPRPWTDQVLPLKLHPGPSDLVRVMVGRAEMITPAIERQLVQQIVRYAQAGEAQRREVVRDTQELGLGRFLEPAVRRVVGQMPAKQFSAQAWDLLQAAGKPTAKGATVAQR